MTSDETPIPEPAAAARTPIRVVLVDDHAMFRSGVRGELAGHTAMVEVVGEAGDVDQAVEAIESTAPDVVLLDVHLPGGGGVQVDEAGADARRPATSRCRSATPPRT